MIVSSVRAVGRVADKVLDADDRRVIGQGLVLVLAFALCVLTVAGSAGLAIKVFEYARG